MSSPIDLHIEELDPPAGGAGDRPTVLIEADDGATMWAAKRLFGREGYRIETCDGPASQPGGRCPLVTGGRCEKAERADAVFCSLEDREPVLLAYAEHLPATSVVVEGFADDLVELGIASGNFVVWPPIYSGSTLLAQLEDVLIDEM